MAVLSEEVAAREMVVAQQDVITQEEVVAQKEVVSKEEIVAHDEVPQVTGETLIDDAPKLATITESPTKATGSLVDKVLWKGTPLKSPAFESTVKQEQLVHTIRQLEKIEAVKARFIYVSTFLTNTEVRSTNPPS